MKAVNQLLFRIFIVQFYKENIGFFLFFFVLFFGLIPVNDLLYFHKALLLAQATSPWVAAGSCALWFLYGLKCTRFLMLVIEKYNISFLHELQSVRKTRLNATFATLFCLAFAPVLLYSFVTIIAAVLQNEFSIALLFFFFLTLTIYFSMKRLITLLHRATKYQGEKNSYNKFFAIGNGYLFLFRFLLNEKKISILILKIFSFGFYYLFLIRYASSFGLPYLIISLLLISYVHSIFVYYLQDHLELKMKFIRTLPIPMYKRVLLSVMPIFLLVLPDLIFMLVNGSEVMTFSEIIFCYFLITGQLFLYLVILYIKRLEIKAFIARLFLIVLTFHFLYIIVDPVVVILVQFGFSFTVFATLYYKYEHLVVVTKGIRTNNAQRTSSSDSLN